MWMSRAGGPFIFLDFTDLENIKVKWWRVILNAIAFILACIALPFLLLTKDKEKK